MRSRQFLCVFLFAGVLYRPTTSEMSGEDKQDLDRVTRDSLNTFALNVFSAVGEKQEGNGLLSPVSLQMVLSLAYIGAGGQTKEELRKILHIPPSLQETLRGYKVLRELLVQPEVDLASRIFVSKTAELKQHYLSNAETHYNASAESLDFKEVDNARSRINSWVEQRTRGKIHDLIVPGMISSATTMVLVNAVHFLDTWEKPFEASLTSEHPFHVSKTIDVPIPMMTMVSYFLFSDDKELDAGIFQMYYKDKKFRMVFVVPNKLDGLKDLESKLKTASLSEKIKTSNLNETLLSVLIPKFKVEQYTSLKQALQTVGAKSMFEQNADFDEMTDAQIVVSDVVQKTFIHVNENGTEAAAATALVTAASSGITPRDFKADHPFIFIITHAYYDVPLFVGRFSAP